MHQLNKRSPQRRTDPWQEKFEALCHEVFHKNPYGKELLEHLERRFFRSPVAVPGQHESWAYFNEGRNELIRSFTNAIQLHINKSRSKDKGNQVNV